MVDSGVVGVIFPEWIVSTEDFSVSDTKYCPGCDHDLDINDFAWKHVAKGIRQIWCKKCLKRGKQGSLS